MNSSKTNTQFIKKAIIVSTHNKIPSNRQYFLLAKQLISEGVEVILVIDSAKKIDDYEGTYYNWTDKTFFSSFYFFWKILRKHKTIDVSILNFSATKFSFLFKLHSKKVIVTIRSDFFANSVVKRFLSSLKFIFSDLIQTNSYYMSGRIQQNYFFLPPIVVIHNSVELKGIFNSQSVKLLSEKKKNVLFVGNLEVHKGFDSLVGTYLKNDWSKKINLTVCGEGSLSYLLFSNRTEIHYLGKISHEDVLQEMHKHDFLILPSRNEAFGQVVIEAMIQKCIPMVAHGTGASEIVDTYKTGFLFNDVSEAFEWCTNLDDEVYTQLQDQISKNRIHFDTNNWINFFKTHLLKN
jgi:glycosyltransferase involved in cell wall biosynthesis